MGERGQTMARAVVIGGPEQHWWRVLAQFVSVGLDHGIMWDPLIVPLDRPRADETSAASLSSRSYVPYSAAFSPSMELLLPLGFRSPHQRTLRASQKNLELAYRPSGHRLVRARAELPPRVLASLVRSDFVLTARRDFISLSESRTGY